MSEREKRVCLDPGHDAGNLANKSPDGTYYEHAFTLDLGKRLEKLLTDRGVSVTTVSYTHLTLPTICSV